jgi:hypothetical protein
MTRRLIELFVTHSIKDTQHIYTSHNDAQHNNTQHNNTQHNDTQYNDTQHNVTQLKGLICDSQHNSIMLNVAIFNRYADCHYAECRNVECPGAD